MRWSDAKGRKVVSTADASTVGKLADVVVDAEACRVVAVAVKKAQAGNTLLWPAITSFGADAVTVAGQQALSAADERVQSLGSKEHRVLGKRVLSTAGEDLGKVKDLDFDAETGALTALVVDRAEVSASRLLASGPYAVVVRA